MDEQADNCGIDEPVLIVNPSNKRALRISRSTDVVRVHKAFRRNGICWKSGQKIKILKGACAKFHNNNNTNNVYATLECFFLEGFLGDANASGDAGVICRTIDISENDGCLLESVEENPKFDLRKSISIPINVIDSGKCLAVEDCEWNDQCQKHPSSIEVLNTTQCRELGIESLLPDEPETYANVVSAPEIVAVVRPATYKSGMKILDQKYMMKDKFEMLLVITYSTSKKPQEKKNIYAGRVEPSSLRDFHGLYVFKPSCTLHPPFQKAGIYTFTFSIRDSSCDKHVVKVKVKASYDVHRLVHAKKISHHNLTSPQHRTLEMARVRETYDKSCLEFEKDLWNEILEIGSRIGGLEWEIKKLEAEQKTIEVNLSECEEIRGQILGSLGKDKIMACVESKSDCAGSLVMKMKHLNAMQDQDRHGLMANIIGIVTLMGTTPTFELSRLFAEYLGDQMLAVVCRHYDDIDLFESYDEDGKLNPNFALHMFARDLGQSINGRYLVLCIEEIRACEVDKDVEGKLLFPDPTLPDGSIPAGFLGYAVNMINIEDHHLDTKTASGYGLRETLFYRLFGETQVYETRKDMKRAISCIKDGAVSMDGGILRGNGAMSLGCLEPDVIFPVEPARNHLSENDTRVMKRCRELRLELKETIRELVEKRKSHEIDLERFYERRDLYIRYFTRLQEV